MNKQAKPQKKLTWLLLKIYQSRQDRERGYALVIGLFLLVSMLGLLGAYAKVTQLENMSSTSSSDSNSGFYAAEAGLNLRAEEIRQKFVDYNKPTGTSPTSAQDCIDKNTSNDGTGDFACETEQFAKSASNQSAFIASTYVIQKNNGQAKIGTVPPGEPFQNLNMQEYGYSVSSIAKKTTASESQLAAILQMDIKTRLIPLFQFAAFYENDLEILPGPEMNLNGPVHTNGSLYLGAGNGRLNLHSQVTLVGDLYNKRKNNNSTYADGKVKIKDAAGNWLNLLFNGTGSTSETTEEMDKDRVDTAWGTQVQIGLEPLILPETSLTDTSGEYYEKAELRIEYTPASTEEADYLEDVPFEIESKSSGSLSEGQLRSLRQPIMVARDLATIADPNYQVCTPETSGVPSLSANDATKKKIVTALQVALVSQPTPVKFSLLSNTNLNLDPDNKLNDVSRTFFDVLEKDLGVNLDPSDEDKLKQSNPAQIAAIPYTDTDQNGNQIPMGGRCFVSAPFQDIGRDEAGHTSDERFYNDREGRDMRLLQINFKSLAIWNRDLDVDLDGNMDGYGGIYVKFDSSGDVSDNNSGNGFSANERLFTRAAADSDAPTGSFQNLGLAAADTSEGGLVFHATIDFTDPDYSDAGDNQSPYGFILTQGKQLMGLAKTTTTPDPTGLTFASDQAVYVQGDYNSVNKQPAGILADSLNVLSNACLDLSNGTTLRDEVVNKERRKNCNINGSKVNATSTTINTAFLAGTDITNDSDGYNGGLENYPRFSERWSGQTLIYRGSFVSLGIPNHVSGLWGDQDYNPPGRNWDYDLDFNSVENLPPLTPRFVFVKQESFRRSFE